LRNTYHLDALLPHEDLQNIQHHLANAGMFKWFNSDWRTARKNLKSMAKSPDTKIAEMVEKLDTLIKYSEQVGHLERSNFSKLL
ncbi:hypothetical protein SB690_20420, partial [Bacillus sp. SIMBA_006]